MITFNCPSCSQKYNVPDEKAGVRAKCKKCGGVMQVPSALAAAPAPARAEPRGVSAHAQPPSATASFTAEGHAGGDGGDFEHAAANLTDDRSVGPRRPGARRTKPLPGRPYTGAQEVGVRRRNFVILGVLLLVAFIMPSCTGGRGGSQVGIINIQGLFEPRVPIAMKLLFVHPLIAGVLCCMAGVIKPPTRGWVHIASGLLPVVLVFAAVPPQIQGELAESLSGPGGLSGVLGLLLSITCLYGIFIGCRLRWYRPLLKGAFITAVVGAAAGILTLVIPDPRSGSIGLVGPFKLMEMDAIIGIGALLWTAALITTCVICFLNTPSLEPGKASLRANLAFWIYVGGLAAMFALVMLRTMSMTMGPGAGGAAMMVVGVLIKMALWVGATLALFPMGVVDVVLSEPVTQGGACQACGYDLRGAPTAACPECGYVN